MGFHFVIIVVADQVMFEMAKGIKVSCHKIRAVGCVQNFSAKTVYRFCMSIMAKLFVSLPVSFHWRAELPHSSKNSVRAIYFTSLESDRDPIVQLHNHVYHCLIILNQLYLPGLGLYFLYLSYRRSLTVFYCYFVWLSFIYPNDISGFINDILRTQVKYSWNNDIFNQQ